MGCVVDSHYCFIAFSLRSLAKKRPTKLLACHNMITHQNDSGPKRNSPGSLNFPSKVAISGGFHWRSRRRTWTDQIWWPPKTSHSLAARSLHQVGQLLSAPRARQRVYQAAQAGCIKTHLGVLGVRRRVFLQSLEMCAHLLTSPSELTPESDSTWT